MKAERQQKETTSRVIQPAKEKNCNFVDNRPHYIAQANIINAIQLKTIRKQGHQNYSVEAPTDDTHWIVPSPKIVIKDRIGRLRGPQFNGNPQITILQPRRPHAGDIGVKYGAKHYGGNAAQGLSGTLCHVYNNGEDTHYHFAIPHYHACCKEGGLTADEAGGNQAIAGENDGLHIHTDDDINRIQVRLNHLQPHILSARGEDLIDQYPGEIP